MLDLESAIKHCEEIADYDCYNDKQMKCAEEHRQLADWLRDYKRLKTIELGKARCTTCKHYGTYAVECRECYEYSRWEGE